LGTGLQHGANPGRYAWQLP